MDKTTLENLMKALDESPENMTLFWMVVRGHYQLEEKDTAFELLQQHLRSGNFSIEEMDNQLLAGKLCLDMDRPELALQLCLSSDATCRILRARAYLELDRLDEGFEEYTAAVQADPTLENKALEYQFKKGEGAETSPQKITKLHVVSRSDNEEDDLKRLLMPDIERKTFAHVGGLDDIKAHIHKRIILPFQKPSLFTRFKKRVGGGILLFGPPGCGKTLLARATAGECNAQFFNVVISDILDMYIGESERKLHGLFENARQNAPAVLFFDEIEALGGKRKYTQESSSSKVISQFLSEMDGFSTNNKGVLIIGATNVPWAIDPAFRRPGRFDRFLFVPPPDRVARERILAIHLDDIPFEGTVDITWLAKNTSGFSGADLSLLVEAATDLAIEASIDSEKEVPLTNTFLKKALKEVRSTTLEWLTTARNYARYANESGQYNDVLTFLEKHGQR